MMKIRNRKKRLSFIKKSFKNYNMKEIQVPLIKLLGLDTVVFECNKILEEKDCVGLYYPYYDIIVVPEKTTKYTYTLLHEIAHAYHKNILKRKYWKTGDSILEPFADWFASTLLDIPFTQEYLEYDDDELIDLYDKLNKLQHSCEKDVKFIAAKLVVK